jgi:hypothetical protein
MDSSCYKNEWYKRRNNEMLTLSMLHGTLWDTKTPYIKRYISYKKDRHRKRET